MYKNYYNGSGGGAAGAAYSSNVIALSIASGIYTIEEFLNSVADDDERAVLKKLVVKCNSTLTHVSVATPKMTSFLVMVAIDQASKEGDSGNNFGSHTSIEDALDALYGNEYSYAVLDWKATPDLFADDGTNTISIYKHEVSYTPPKGCIGVFVSDEQLTTPAMRTQLLIVQLGTINNGDIPWIHFTVNPSFSISQRRIELAEL